MNAVKYYFGVQVWSDQPIEGSARTKRVQRIVWGRSGYDTPQEAVEANLGYISEHLGTRFLVQCFDKHPGM